MNGYINLPMMISHSDDDSGFPVSGESMWGADRVIKLDDESSEKTSAAQTTWEVTLLASELPYGVGQQQGCSQPTGFQAWMGEYLNVGRIRNMSRPEKSRRLPVAGNSSHHQVWGCY